MVWWRMSARRFSNLEDWPIDILLREPVSGARGVAGGGLLFRARLPDGLLTGATRQPTMFLHAMHSLRGYAPECVDTRYIRGVLCDSW